MQALRIENLKKTYKSGLEALKGISFNVEQSDFFALLGPNGAGKSTTIGIITSLVNKTSGKVFVFDHDIDTELEAAKSCVGLVPQEFNFSIFEKVMQILVNQAGYYGVPRGLAHERAEYYLKELGIWKKHNESAGKLSGGMKRRLMIARALIHEPKLLILDEPTAGVDIETRRKMWDFLQQKNAEGTTIILTTHYLEEAESLCKNIAIIDHGHIIENSAMDTLLQKLNKETIVLYLKTAFTQPPFSSNFPLQVVNNKTLEAEIKDDQTIHDLFLELATQGIYVERIKNKTNRLEELFINLTTK